jgi:hypothetical protein
VDEGGRHHAPLLLVKVLLAREEIVAQKGAREEAEAVALHECVRLFHEHLVGELRRRQDVTLHEAAEHPDRLDVDVAAREVQEERDAILRKARTPFEHGRDLEVLDAPRHGVLPGRWSIGRM